MNRNVILLSLCQALLTTGNVLLISVNALIGQQLSPSPGLITLPVAMQFVGLMCATIPASLVMARIGRKNGFYLGNSVGIVGALCCIFALQQSQFFTFCLGTFLLGIGIGFGTLYRFAAVEACPDEQKSRAISMVMAGGVIAAVLGPNLAISSRDWLDDSVFTGAFVGLAVLYVIALVLLSFIRIAPQKVSVDQHKNSRPILDIVMQPVFIVAATVGMISYAVMNLIMTVTPVAMARCGFDFSTAAWVIEWHVLGMFLPSFITPVLIRRFGLLPMMILGALFMLACIFLNLHGVSQWHFWAALALLGVGWNFMFISATQLVTSAYRTEEKAKSQAANEFLVFGMVTVSAFSSGWLESSLGWQVLNTLMIPVVIWAVVVVLCYRKSVNQHLKAL
ncbi:MFS transporter [Amphritea japonica]|uniref:MFS transporter n=1 Tax=Amphritea japonica ATCC BAA-1530 TaxID=1278309 RepID=A0A7R6P3R9_9GAMM|nr:MFS transporter [Amphritea japonica]BBB26494.1 MFS transporter [Amphritea japonica ATCC BAA-1530]